MKPTQWRRKNKRADSHQDVTVPSDDWYLLKKTTFDFRRSNGRWQTLSREAYDRGNGAVILLVNSEEQTLILTSQFRYIEIVELTFDQAFAMMTNGEILDAKTLILLQRLAIMCRKSPNLSASS